MTALVTDAAGRVWIATAKGVSHLPSEATSATTPQAALTGPAAAIGIDRGGSILAALSSGALEAIGPGAPTSALPPESRLRHVDALFQDETGAVWIGTLGDGLRLLDHGRLTAFHTADGLFDDTIYGIVADDHGLLWMACSKGIFFNPSGGSDAAWPRARPDRLRARPTVQPKPSAPSSVNPASNRPSRRMADGSLWFSTIRGVLTLDPAHLDRRLASPPAVIEEVTVDGALTPASGLAALSPGPKNVEFRYTGLSLVVPTRLTFRYRLDPFDPDWVDAGTRRQAFYTNLPHGRFHFLVRACLPDGTCSESPSEVAILIAPHLYERGWFIPLVGLVLAGAGWGLYQQRIRRLRANFALVLAERARIARELHDTLVQGFAGIAMAVKAVSDRLPTSSDRQKLEGIVSDSADCLPRTRARDPRRVAGGRPRPRAGRRAGGPPAHRRHAGRTRAAH